MGRRIRLASQPERIARRRGSVYLRPPAPADEREFLALRHESRRFLSPWGMQASPARNFRVFLDQGPGTSRERWLVCAKSDGAILGAITIGAIRHDPFQSAVIGCWIAERHARKGYMTEAFSLVIRRAFGELGLRRLEADILPENRASKRLIRRAGFVKEGLAREFAHVAGRRRDHERWALLARDAKKSQRPQSRK